MAFEANLNDALLEEIARELGINEDDLKNNRFFKLIKGVFPVYILNLAKKTSPFGGELVDNLTAVTLVNNVSKVQVITVPPLKRWYLFGGRIKNGDDVARNCHIQIRNVANDVILNALREQSIAAAASVYFPNTEAHVGQVGSGAYPVPMNPGWDLNFTWLAGGASAGGDAIATALVVEIDE